MITEIDNFFPIFVQKKIIQTILSPKLPWYHRASLKNRNLKEVEKICELDKNIILGQGFIHTFYDENQQSEIIDKFDILSAFVLHTEKKFNLKIEKLLRLQVLQVLPYPHKDSCYMMPHVDFMFPHKTLLYYVTDTQGDTFIFNEKSELNKKEMKNKELFSLAESTNVKTLKKKIVPKQGRAVLFDGLYYHAASFPTTDNRYVINFNFI